MVRRIAFIFLVSAFVTGCGGGRSTSLLPQAASTPFSGSASTTAPQKVAVTIAIPRRSSATAALRRPAYVSENTNSAAIAVNGGTPVTANLTQTSPNCVTKDGVLSCTLNVMASVGSDTFAVTLYSGTNATGAVLSKGTAPATIVAGQANTVALTLNGIIQSLALALTPANPPQGTAAPIEFSVTAKDASGATIVGGDDFSTPITLTDTDTSGATVLSKTTLKSPSDEAGLTLAYNGNSLAAATFGATAGAVSASTVTLTPQAPVNVTFNDYTTFGYDNQRDSYNPNSTAITPSSVAKLHLAWQASLGDYNMQSQPTLATEIPNHAGVLYVGGGSGRVYARDALTGQSVWSVYTGRESYVCDPNSPGKASVFGVGGTAAYDPGSKSLYIVANTNSATNAFAQNLLMHLDAATGTKLNSYDFGQGQAGKNELNFSHTSVTLSNGVAYVGTGATCDISSWRGRVAAVNVPAMTGAGTFFTTWNPDAGQSWGGGGVWGWGGVTLDYNGNVLAGVGNTDNGLSSNGQITPPFTAAPKEYSAYGDSLVELSGDLSRVIGNTKPVPQSLYATQQDLDVNGTPVVFAPSEGSCDPMVALQSKAGALLLFDEANIGRGAVAQYQFAPAAYSDGFLGVTAFSKATNMLYSVVASNQSPTFLAPGMVAINPGCGSPSIVWHASFGPDGTSKGSPRSVPAPSAGGVIFVATPCDGSTYCGAVGTGGAVWELDASAGTILNNGQPIMYTSTPVRAPATIDGSWVYIVDTGGDLYGLTIDPHFATISAIKRSPDSRLFNRMLARPK